MKALVLWGMLVTAFPLFVNAETFVSEGQKVQVETLVKDRDDAIWGFDFLADGRIIFTERSGTLHLFDPKTKKITLVKGTPKVWANGQGGLLDVRVRENKIFLTYSEPVGSKQATTALGVGELSGSELKNFKKLFSAHQPNSNNIHFGSRIEFDNAGHVFITVGDRNERDHAQKLNFHAGKTLRLNEDGTVPTDNPFVGNKSAKPEIWSYGHRNQQGLTRHPVSGALWSAEMGPRGGDEVNLIEPGKNYGWPIVTYGKEYWGPSIGAKSAPGITAPQAYWVPSISPSAITIYNGDVFPKWKGNAFLATLSGTHLRRLVLDGNKVGKQEVLLDDFGARLRNVRAGPEGLLYMSTDDGRILRLIKVK